MQRIDRRVGLSKKSQKLFLLFFSKNFLKNFQTYKREVKECQCSAELYFLVDTGGSAIKLFISFGTDAAVS
jgi:hypothetical protein